MNNLNVTIKENVASEVLAFLEQYETKQVLIITDQPVVVAYNELLESLNRYPIHILKRNEPLVPDESAVSEINDAMTKNTTLLVAVGSGVINDLCRYVSFEKKIAYIAIMSAPSMDGYASTAAPLIVKGFKTTFYCHKALALFGDEVVLKNAPIEMIGAGLGDFVGKITAIMDWELAGIITKETVHQEICEDLYKGMDYFYSQLELCSHSNEDLMKKVSQLAPDINRWLIRSGTHMAVVGNSRPASGMEHMISHVIEMKRLKNHEKGVFHGIKVGVATSYVLKLYREMMNHLPEIVKIYNLDVRFELAIKALYNEGMTFEPFVSLYNNLIQEYHDINQEEIVQGILESIHVRDRFVVGTVLDKLGLLDEDFIKSVM